jgi:transposase
MRGSTHVNNVTTVRIDLAKTVFSVRGVDAEGDDVLRKTVGRTKLSALIGLLPRCVIGLVWSA